MPNDSIPKTSDSQNPFQGLWNKLNFTSTLSVRARRASDSNPNRPTMFPANSREKKRKRSMRSLRTPGRAPMANPKEPPPHQDPGSELERCLANEELSRAYSQKRADLINKEAEDAWDRAAIDDASPNEKRAMIIVREMREYERRVVFGNNASEAIPGKHTLDMGGQFLTNKERIEHRSLLFKLSHKVPKGAILHLHFNAELNPERLLKEAQTIPNMYVWSIKPLLTKEDLDSTEMMFKVMEADPDKDNNDIFSDKYEGRENTWKPQLGKDVEKKVWMRWDEFQARFKVKFPGLYEQPEEERAANQKSTFRTCSEPDKVDLSPAENWIKQKMVLSEEEAYDPKQTVNGVWARFNQATRCFKGLLNYRKVYEWYIEKAIDRMIDEGVMYAELRPMLLDKSIPTDDGKGTLDNAAQMKLIVDSVEKKRAALKAKNKGDLFPFGLKIIYCTPRSIPPKLMLQEMKDCIQLKLQYPDLICGFDLVGAEDRPNHIGYYYKELVAFQETCKKMGLKIPFLFHAGETLLDTGGSTDPTNSNLFDAVALNSKRIGHGFALMKHPHLVEKFKKRDTNPGICVELCPISNELLHLCRNIKEHPYPELLAAKIPCCVNSDNPSLFSNSMSHEFYQVMVGSPTISIHSWKQLALWSLEYSCLKDDEKTKGRDIFLKAWETFCEGVVEKYDHYMTGDKINEGAAKELYSKLDSSA
ncbi:Metallo-dependent hydrolase [Lentithecium fluviatile CBS 122367]|uniref:Metallo-dependent hydrolase n=1 Tax=Lentithecium fluviatile CBS 122367 TaxID=1168545 RepID=A0A6G1IKW9_9PLEO|nr:Metallo-dependent hydrolase [Lentithecium fluviatile CBS 122367]